MLEKLISEDNQAVGRFTCYTKELLQECSK